MGGAKLLELLDANNFKMINSYIANKTLLSQEAADVRQEGRKPSEEMALRGLDGLLKVTLQDDVRRNFFYPDKSIIDTIEEYIRMRNTIRELEPAQEHIMKKFRSCPTMENDFKLDTDVQHVSGRCPPVGETWCKEGSERSTATKSDDSSAAKSDDDTGGEEARQCVKSWDDEFVCILKRLNILDHLEALEREGVDQVALVRDVEDSDFLEAVTNAGVPKIKAKALYKSCCDAVKATAMSDGFDLIDASQVGGVS